MKEITATELNARMKSGEEIILIDVREPYENEEFNIGGVNIPLAEIPESIERLKAYGDADVVLYCRSGNRSGMAQKILAVQFDMHNTVNLKGGMNAWKADVRE
ncbi:MAG: rhodanese-like domain-containing protein [Saprospiraceae bacterium]|uniref:Rhodanese-like domain-containing protein n=1 Tax=Candidatus Opimibacter skivensis TaxID=2982028 RepID=A0A9D7XU96_9BACT|nr:rhodanese-like domain-containing protein [Candidatus Opimibacter skivensis]